MGKKILFSPIGGNDPISAATGFDGSMLHICRYYKPDIIYLYLSKEMVDRQRRDSRYTYCIERLGEMLGHPFIVHLIENEDLTEVQEYDFYYEEFGAYITKIEADMEQEDSLFFNIASGTPAMKSALLLLSVLSEKKIVSVQVTTPEKRINVHYGVGDNVYSPEEFWELNQDNEQGAKNRCTEPKCQNLSDILKKNIIIKQLRNYNYSAAFTLAKELKNPLEEETMDLLEMAEARSQLDLVKVQKLSGKWGYDVFPIRQGNQMQKFEYVLTLQLKVKKREFADFIRGISPILTDLFLDILKNKCKMDVTVYFNQTPKGEEWSIKKLEQDAEGKRIYQLLNAEFGTFKERTKVAASNLKPVLIQYLNEDNLKDAVADMRRIEEKIRNLAAHQIVSITNESIQKILNEKITMEKIFKYIQTLTIASSVKTDKECWESYDKMNEYIIDKL